jgi:predicted N-acetyltransferase YhbS
MAVTLRPFAAADVSTAGRICHDAFRAIASEHNYPPDFPTPEIATGLLTALFEDPGFYGVAAEIDGRVVGSNFIDERAPIIGLGPITVDPATQNRGVGKSLMTHMLDRARHDKAPGVRLIQAGYHRRSLCLYTQLGFAVREHLTNLQGPPLRLSLPGHPVRRATSADLAACNRLCRVVHGFDRGGSLRDAIDSGSAAVVEQNGRITGYTTEIGFGGHAVAESNEDLKALIGAASVFGGPGFLLPSRNTELFQWCLAQGLKMVQSMTLMTVGLYNEPRGAYLPSIWF